jgi:hypothetical protein
MSKFNSPDFPKDGWLLGNVVDNIVTDFICEACESHLIRYVHHLTHPAYADELKCGCVCAGRMTNDPAGATLLDQQARAETRRADLRRKQEQAVENERKYGTWKVTARGNHTSSMGQYRATVFQDGDLFRFIFSNATINLKETSHRFSDLLAAKLNATSRLRQAYKS